MGFKRKPTSLLGATALVGGTTVGAGILALPAATIKAGLLPSSVALIMMWMYMAATGLLIAEVNVNVICRQGTPGVGLLALAERALGTGGARFTGLVYVFIHYALLVAYMAQGGELLAEGLGAALSLGPGQGLPEWVGPSLFCAAVGGLVVLGSEELVEGFNNALVGILLVTFGALLATGTGGVHPQYLLQQDWGAAGAAIPVMYVACVFHNVVPVVTTQLEGDVGKIRTAVVVGSAVPLLMFLAWNAVILGTVPAEAAAQAAGAGQTFDPLEVLRQGAAAGGTGDRLGLLVSLFSEVAIITSFNGFVVGLLDFFTDVFNVPLGDKGREAPLYGLILGPPLAVACTDPGIFFSALDSAGTFGISLLCGVLPAAMAFAQRYREQEPVATLPLVPGGQVTLSAIAGFAFVVIGQKVVEMASTMYS